MEPITRITAAISRPPGDRRQFARYLGIGVLATLVDWTIFYLLVSFLGVFYLLALATSYGASTVLNFFLNRRYTFRNKFRQVHVQLALFSVVAVAGLGLNEIIMFGLAWMTPGGVTGFSLMASRVFATVVVFAWNFTLNRRLTFGILR